MKVFFLTLMVFLRVAYCKDPQCSKDDGGKPWYQASVDSKWSGDTPTAGAQEDIAKLRAGQAQTKDALSKEFNKYDIPSMRDDIDNVKHRLSQLRTLENKVKALEELIEKSKKQKKDTNKKSDEIQHELKQQNAQLQKCSDDISKLHASSEELEKKLETKFGRALETHNENLKAVQEQTKESVLVAELLNTSLARLKENFKKEEYKLAKINNDLEGLKKEVSEISNFEEKYDHDLDVVKQNCTNMTESVRHSLIDELEKQKNATKQVKDKLHEESIRVSQTKTELEELKADFSKQLDDTQRMLKTDIEKVSATAEENLQDGLGKEHEFIMEIQKELQNFEDDISDSIDSLKKETHERIDDVKSSGENLVQSLKSEVHKELNDLKDHLKTLKAELDWEHAYTSETFAKLERSMASLAKQTEENKRTLESRIEDAEIEGKNHVRTVQQSLLEQLGEQQDKVNIIYPNTFNKETFAKLERSMASLAKQTEENKRTLESRIEDAEIEGKNHVRTVQKSLLEQLGEQQDKVNIIYPNTFNKESVSMAGVVVVCLLFLMKGSVVFLVVIWRQESVSMAGVVVVCWLFLLTVVVLVVIWGQGQKAREVKVTLGKTPEEEESRSKELQNNVLIISYDVDMTTEYRDMVTTATAACGDVGVVCYNIQQEQQLADMPASKVCIMFVEYSERHVIIETPGLGLGSLKRKTLEAARKNGSCVVIIYARDPGSRSLQSHQRYNSDISCVTSQPELSSLDDLGMFFSVYSKFTTSQTICLRDIVSRKLCR